MTSQQFGQLALQLPAAQIHGDALETALAFKAAATELAQGRMTLTPTEPPKGE